MTVRSFLTVLAACLLSLPARAAEPNIRFTRFNIENGLSQSAIRAIIQDRKGFLWFGTEDGLDRFDGFNFKIYRPDLEDPDSLSSGNINALLADRRGFLWVGTRGGGVNKYDPWTERFIRFRTDPGDPESLSEDDIAALLEDRSGKIWVGTLTGGLNRLDPATGKSVRYRAQYGQPGKLSDDSITALVEDQNGLLWIGTRNGGVNAFDPATESFTRIRPDPGGPGYDSIVSLDLGRSGDIWAGTAGGILRIDTARKAVHLFSPGPRPFAPSAGLPAGLRVTEDSRGVLWIGTLGNGLYRFDGESNRLTHFLNEPLSSSSLGNNFVYLTYEDSGGVLWIGTENGLNKTDLNAKKFLHYASVASDPASLSNNYVMAFAEDSRGEIWVGTLQGGMNSFNPRTGSFVRLPHVPGIAGRPSGNRVTSLHTGASGTVWIGLYGSGVDMYDPATRTFRKVPVDSLPTSGINNPRVMEVLEDRTGLLWVGTQTGLHQYDPKTRQSTEFRSRPEYPAGLSHDYVYTMLEDREGRIWIGTFGGGLNRYLPESATFVRYQAKPENPSTLSNDFVSCLFEDAQGILWVGTAGGGLNRFDPQTGKVRRYSDHDGLPNNSVYGIRADDEGRLWISTNVGLSRFDPKSGVFRNFDVSDGLQSNEFNGRAAFRSRDGDMYFGGINGFNRFRPEEIIDNSFNPPIVLTDFQILGRSVFAPGGDDRTRNIRKSLSDNRELALSYRDRVIDLEFAAMHMASPGKTRYTYRLEGFDPDWSPPGARRLATYTNLKGGRYVFKVRATNNDGVWNTRELALPIRIFPPFWQTGLFRALALAGVLFAILAYVRIHTNRIRAQNVILEKRVEERTEKLKSANEELEREIGERTRAETELQTSLREKEILLREIHHRVKNNMQVVSSFLNIQARSSHDPQVRDIFQKTQDRVRMMALIHENLYKSRDLGGIDASAFLKETVDHLSSYIIDPDKIALKPDIGKVTLDIDTAIPCGLIVNELVTNAVKYAFPPEAIRARGESFRGEIVVSLHPDDGRGFLLIVRDNGIGIPEGLESGRPGSLGLQLVKGLVAQIHGTLQTVKDQGTRFTIRFGRK